MIKHIIPTPFLDLEPSKNRIQTLEPKTKLIYCILLLVLSKLFTIMVQESSSTRFLRNNSKLCLGGTKEGSTSKFPKKDSKV